MQRLRRARHAAGLTQVELANQAGCTQQTVSYLETGKIRTPSWRVVQSLAAALNVDPREVFPTEEHGS
jgi:transcriptional regulator with XRE-family HTH domain